MKVILEKVTFLQCSDEAGEGKVAAREIDDTCYTYVPFFSVGPHIVRCLLAQNYFRQFAFYIPRETKITRVFKLYNYEAAAKSETSRASHQCISQFR